MVIHVYPIMLTVKLKLVSYFEHPIIRLELKCHIKLSNQIKHVYLALATLRHHQKKRVECNEWGEPTTTFVVTNETIEFEE